MKKMIFFAVLAVLVSCGSNQEQTITPDIINNPNTADGIKNADELPVIEFKEERIEFGDITQGEKITREFEFTNTGKSDLVITNVAADCGCTLAKDWPKEPVKPGQGGKFNVTFDSENKQGQQVKKITVMANTSPSITVVALSGNVIVPGKK